MIVIKTILAFIVAVVVGFIVTKMFHLFIMRYWLYPRLFHSALRYIEMHGRGFSDQENLTAISRNLSARLRMVLHVTAGLLVLTVLSAIILGRFEAISVPVAIAIVFGYLVAGFAFIWVHICIEMESKTICGRLVDVKPDRRWMTFQISEDNQITFDYSGSAIREDILVCGKKYLVGNYLYSFSIAPCDYYEWNDRKFPGDS